MANALPAPQCTDLPVKRTFFEKVRLPNGVDFGEHAHGSLGDVERLKKRIFHERHSAGENEFLPII